MKDSAPVRIQWDPDRALSAGQLPRRPVQIGLSRDAVRLCCDQWIRSITDTSGTVREIAMLPAADRAAAPAAQLPADRVYPLDPDAPARIGADPHDPADCGPGAAT